MSRLLGVGRTSVRETYKILAAEGCITRSKRGTSVNDRNQINRALPFSAAIEVSDYNDLIEFRTIFESQIAYLAAMRATQEEIQQLEDALGKMRDYRRDLGILTYHDTQFHMILAGATHNSLLKRIMNMSMDIFAVGMFNAFNVDTERNVRQALASHEAILEGVRRRDPQAAYDAMYTHVQQVRGRGIPQAK